MGSSLNLFLRITKGLHLSEAQKVEITKLKEAITALEKENTRLRKELEGHNQKKRAEPCPSCHEYTLELERIEDDPIMGDVGLRHGFYKCSNCGKKHKKEIPLDY